MWNIWNIWMNLGKLQKPHCSPSLESLLILRESPFMAWIQVSEFPIIYPDEGQTNDRTIIMANHDGKSWEWWMVIKNKMMVLSCVPFRKLKRIPHHTMNSPPFKDSSIIYWSTWIHELSSGNKIPQNHFMKSWLVFPRDSPLLNYYNPIPIYHCSIISLYFNIHLNIEYIYIYHCI